MQIPIRIITPKYMNTSKKRIKIDEIQFRKDLMLYLDNIENKEIIDNELTQKLLDYGINKKEFDEMNNELEKFASYDDDKTTIGFPYEMWIPKLLEVYDKDIDKV